MYFKNKLKYSKRSYHVIDDVMSHFWSFQKLLSRTLVSCRVIKRRLSTAFGLVCRLFAHVHCPLKILNAGRQLVIFKCPTQPKPICF